MKFKYEAVLFSSKAYNCTESATIFIYLLFSHMDWFYLTHEISVFVVTL